VGRAARAVGQDVVEHEPQGLLSRELRDVRATPILNAADRLVRRRLQERQPLAAQIERGVPGEHDAEHEHGQQGGDGDE
jgi:hypothetical protein